MQIRERLPFGTIATQSLRGRSDKLAGPQSLNLPFDTIAMQSLRGRSGSPADPQSLRGRFGARSQSVTEWFRRPSRERIEVQ
ncbi:MAG: hypothetical protein U9Q77_11260, partial [Candidatus Marinimicrobia bacterium]|nr:hypothetical protein [Candidatus Neomarinimicrobiota bacterium]